jgi:hypothetical protein
VVALGGAKPDVLRENRIMNIYRRDMLKILPALRAGIFKAASIQ